MTFLKKIWTWLTSVDECPEETLTEEQMDRW